MNWQDVLEGVIGVLAVLSFGFRFLLNKPNEPVRVVEDAFAESKSNRCVITGQVATEHHDIVFTQSSILFFFWLQPIVVNIPFSTEGWSIYKQHRPLSVAILNVGTRFSFFLSPLWFFSYGLIIFPIIAIVDVVRFRRQLISMPLLPTQNRLTITETYLNNRLMQTDGTSV